MKTTKQLIDELTSEVCPFCAKKKAPKKTLCGQCYRSLPYVLRQGLWMRIGNGYEEGYVEAIVWLTEQRDQAVAAAAETPVLA